MLVDQGKMRPPLEVPRHSMSNEQVDVESSNKEVDTRTSSRGHLGLENDDHRHSTGNNVSERWTAYNTPSQIREIGYLPVSQHPMCSKMHNEICHSPQMAVNSSQ